MENVSDSKQSIFEYVITSLEVDDYMKNGDMSNRLQRFWNHFVDSLPVKYQEEAREKGFVLVDHNTLSEKTDKYFYRNLMFSIPKASIELERYVSQMDGNIIICMKDPI